MEKVKDIFIDTNIAKNFSKSDDPEYKKLVAWLIFYNPKKHQDNAHLMISQKLLNEYVGSSTAAKSNSNITAILKELNKIHNGNKSRLIRIPPEEIKKFQREHIIRSRNLKILYEQLNKDRDHIPLVLLSYRKFALTIEPKFKYVLENYPGYKARVEERPEKLPYKNGEPL